MHRRLVDYLTQTYGDKLFVRNGERYPVMVFPSEQAQHDVVDSILTPDDPREFVDPETFPIYDADHLAELRRTRDVTNGMSYVLHRLSFDPLTVEARLGHYYDMLATCDALDQELRSYARGEQDGLPHREQFHAAITPEEALYSGAGRCAIIGVATLTVFNHERTYKAIVAKRSNRLAVGAGLYHVVPAFVFQPSGPEAFYSAEWSLKHQILREFGEELFAMPEFAEWDGVTIANYFYDEPPVHELLTMLDNGHAALHLTGVAMNLLTLRAEICTLLVIHDPDWYARWKDELRAALFTERQETLYVPVDDTSALPDNLPMQMTPHGAAALWMGIDRVKELVQSKR